MVRLQAQHMTSEAWHKIQQQAKVWRVGALPGLVVLGCVILCRSAGMLQNLEWAAYDHGLRSRPIEPPDARVVIVGINEDDIRRVGNFPVPDRPLAQLIQTLQTYKPRVIGLDLFRDLTNTPGRAELAHVLATSDNLIGIEVALPSDPSRKIKPPPELPVARIGVTDAIPDPDGKLRRQLLATRVNSGATRYSWALLLAKFYLQGEGVRFQPGDRPSAPLSFMPSSTALRPLILPRFTRNDGGYVNALAGGNQLLINFRSHPQPFPVVSMTDVMTGKVKPEQLRDRVVLIGMTNASNNDTFMTSAIRGSIIAQSLNLDAYQQYQLIYGVEINAHAVSAIISAVLDHRPLVQTWAEFWEYLWILGCGIWGIGVGLFFQSPWKTLLSLGCTSIGITALGYGLLLQSIWMPMVPSVLGLIGAGLTTAFFDQRAKALLEERSLTLKRTYNAVHNGPLQTLAAILRSDLPSERVRSQLQNLNWELRSVYEAMHQSLLTIDETDRQTSLPEMLYAVYEKTLQRDLPGFATIKTYIPPDFSCLVDSGLSPSQQQNLCIFLEEALCNVGKHAVNASCLDVVCDRPANGYRLRIIDNGMDNRMTEPESPQSMQGWPARTILPKNGGWGTTQATELAHQLYGHFQRRPHKPHGLVCELRWYPKRSRWQVLTQTWRKISLFG